MGTTCEEDTDACLSVASKLAAIQTIEVWAEGVAGVQHLEIESVSAEPSSFKVVEVSKAEATASTGVILVDSDASTSVTFADFVEVNDPVMGGRSTGSFEVAD